MQKWWTYESRIKNGRCIRLRFVTSFVHVQNLTPYIPDIPGHDTLSEKRRLNGYLRISTNWHFFPSSLLRSCILVRCARHLTCLQSWTQEQELSHGTRLRLNKTTPIFTTEAKQCCSFRHWLSRIFQVSFRQTSPWRFYTIDVPVVKLYSMVFTKDWVRSGLFRLSWIR